MKCEWCEKERKKLYDGLCKKCYDSRDNGDMLLMAMILLLLGVPRIKKLGDMFSGEIDILQGKEHKGERNNIPDN